MPASLACRRSTWQWLLRLAFRSLSASPRFCGIFCNPRIGINVVPQIDMTPPNKLEETLSQVVKILRSRGCRRVLSQFSFSPFSSKIWILERIRCSLNRLKPPSRFRKSMPRTSRLYTLVPSSQLIFCQGFAPYSKSPMSPELVLTSCALFLA
jgi:hypothetical protein